MQRRTVLKATGSNGIIIALAGCLGNIQVFGEREGDDGDSDTTQNESESNNTTTTDTTETTGGRGGGDTGNDERPSENDTVDDETNSDSDSPKAADPETEDPVNESDAARPEDVADTQPTTDDITIHNATLTTDSSGATVTGTLTNANNSTLDVVDVEVTFLEDGTVLTTAMWGTNTLRAGESWDFEISADGSEYSSVTDYEITVLL